MSRDVRAQGAESGRAVIRGVVRSDAGLALANVEIFDSTDHVRVRSGAHGEFSLTTNGGSHRISVRLPGHRPVDTTFVIRAGESRKFDPVLVRFTTLDTVVTRELPVDCNDATVVAGFNCRRLHLNGIFLDQLEIARKQPVFLADAFWGVPGLVLEGTRNGRRVASKDGRCIQLLIDGRPPVGPHLPEAKDLRAVEVYEKYEDVPYPYRTYSWAPPGKSMPVVPCVIINMWTE